MTDRPKFPKRALITAGMPYGSKELHFGHVGGVFVHADAFARFLRDRIGKDNVIFVSGTDCYGSPIVEKYKSLTADGSFKGSIIDFVQYNHDKQAQTLDDYLISPSLFAASALGESGKIHTEYSAEFFEKLAESGALIRLSTKQFYDEKYQTFLNGRQVTGRCPIEGCKSEVGYADECSLGHQYFPEELIAPVSTLSGERPILKNVENWYFDLEKYMDFLIKMMDEKDATENLRKTTSLACREFLKNPIIYAKLDDADAIKEKLASFPCRYEEEESRKMLRIIFDKLADREAACEALSEAQIRFRTGKTLVPFRLSGNIDWGVPVPEKDGIKGLTFWVWPESLWAPISFTQTYLESIGHSRDEWKDYWCDDDAIVYQFIGEDNIYFYHLAEMAMFEAINEAGGYDKKFKMPRIIANKHLLFFDKKASSSGKIKPPMASELLKYYSAEQLRAHFLGLALGLSNAPFQPKVYNPNADEKAPDPACGEWNMFTNILNRATRTLFYSFQKYNEGNQAIPRGEVSPAVKAAADAAIVKYENHMANQSFHQVIYTLDEYFRLINKEISASFKQVGDNFSKEAFNRAVIDAVHMVKTATVLAHPIAPKSTEAVMKFMNMPDEVFSWDNIFDSVDKITEEGHKFSFLEPRSDFYTKPEWQY